MSGNYSVNVFECQCKANQHRRDSQSFNLFTLEVHDDHVSTHKLQANNFLFIRILFDCETNESEIQLERRESTI